VYDWRKKMKLENPHLAVGQLACSSDLGTHLAVGHQEAAERGAVVKED
jgi:hypothetical protein